MSRRLPAVLLTVAILALAYAMFRPTKFEDDNPDQRTKEKDVAQEKQEKKGSPSADLTEQDERAEETETWTPKTDAPKTDAQWKQILTKEEFYVMRKKGTEQPRSGEYWNTKEKGTYLCRGCGQKLFRSETKFDSGTGWPSFWAPIDEANIATEDDYTFFSRRRTEVHCSRCGAHLGHVFEDGPDPTGLRYCMNSVSLRLRPEGSKADR